MNPKAKYLPWKTGPDPITPTPGVNDLATMVPVAEPASVGAPPTAPVVESMDVGAPPVRSVNVRGWRVTAPKKSAFRPRFTVRWSGQSRAEYDALVGWLLGLVRGTLLAWDLEVDGPGSTPIKVRFTDTPRESNTAKNAWAIEGDVEEVW